MTATEDTIRRLTAERDKAQTWFRLADIAADNWRAEADRMKRERDRYLTALKAHRDAINQEAADRVALGGHDPIDRLAGVPWRVGLTVGRTVYAGDVLIGMFDTAALAARAVADHNAAVAL